MSSVIKIENLWKEYRLGVIGHGTLTHDLQSWWARVRGKDDPNDKIAPMLAGQEKQIDGDHFWALRDINLDVKQGEVLGIIGSNGAGKSTLLKVLSRVTAPSKGNLKVKGRIASLLEVGTGFHPELTGRENIFLNGAILGMSKGEIKSKLEEIIDFSGIEDFVDTPVKRYSSGMYVRLAFAVAAHLEPEILIIDEVLAVGDTEFQKKCLGKMGEVAQEGRTILFVSHNLDMVNRLCNKCMLLKHGQVSCVDKTKNVLNTYLVDDYKVSSYYKLDCSTNDPGVRVEKIIIENQKGEESNNLNAGVPWQLRIFFEFRRKYQGVTVALGFSNELGVPITTTWSEAIDFHYGKYIAVFKEETIWLAPGDYKLTIGLSCGHTVLFYKEEFGILRINELLEGSPLKNINNAVYLNQMNVVISER